VTPVLWSDVSDALALRDSRSPGRGSRGVSEYGVGSFREAAQGPKLRVLERMSAVALSAGRLLESPTAR